MNKLNVVLNVIAGVIANKGYHYRPDEYSSTYSATPADVMFVLGGALDIMKNDTKIRAIKHIRKHIGIAHVDVFPDKFSQVTALSSDLFDAMRQAEVGFEPLPLRECKEIMDTLELYL